LVAKAQRVLGEARGLYNIGEALTELLVHGSWCISLSHPGTPLHEDEVEK
jgi:hypothetical protein